MSRATILRSIFVLLVIVLGNLQAWDSHAFSASLWIVLLVSFAIAVPAIALLIPLRPVLSLLAIALALILLGIARLISPTPLPGLFLVLVPSAMGLIFTGIVREK